MDLSTARIETMSDPITNDGEFSSTNLRLVNGLPLAGFALVGVLLAAFGGISGVIFGVPIALVCGYFSFRGFRLGLVCSADGMTARGIARTRRWAWSEIANFDVAIRPVGAMAYRRKVLVVRLKGGREIVLKDQNGSPKNTDVPSWIDYASYELNHRLALHR